jgi:hypothetical protein
MPSDLLELIRQKQSRLVELRREIEAVQRELDSARQLLMNQAFLGRSPTPAEAAVVSAAVTEAFMAPPQYRSPEGEGSSVTLALAVLRAAQRPMHVAEIVLEIERRF